MEKKYNKFIQYLNVRKDIKMLLLIVVGSATVGLYGFIVRKIDKSQVLSMEFNGVVKKVKFYRAQNIDVVINGEKYGLRAYGLYINIHDGDMEDGDGGTTYKQSCIIDPGDSLIKKKDQYPILLIKKNHRKIHLKCKYDDSSWY